VYDEDEEEDFEEDDDENQSHSLKKKRTKKIISGKNDYGYKSDDEVKVRRTIYIEDIDSQE
jgi:hypothetical protein